MLLAMLNPQKSEGIHEIFHLNVRWKKPVVERFKLNLDEAWNDIEYGRS